MFGREISCRAGRSPSLSRRTGRGSRPFDAPPARTARHSGITTTGDVDAALYKALGDYPPFNRLVNETMLAAVSLSELPGIVFDNSVPSADTDKATTVLLALGSRAREKAGEASLLPCRIHS